MELFASLEQQVKTYLPEEQIVALKEAYLVAKAAHEGQFRTSGEPYITHPVAVANILASMGLDYQTLIAALLHDVIEDTHITYMEIKQQFGHCVAELVDGVSKLDKLKFRNFQEAQAENFRKMIMAMVQDLRVILIKLADRTHNMRTIMALRPEKRRRIAKETLEIYSPLAHRLGIHDIKNELEDRSFEAIYPNRHRVLNKVVHTERLHRKDIIQTVLSDIEDRLKQAGIDAVVSGREKHLYSIYRKMHKNAACFDSIMDIYAFRIVVNDVDTCYRVMGQIHGLYKPRPGRVKDYIAIPKANGYQALHSSLIGPRGVPVELQICTHDMEQVAEMGVAADWAYKTPGHYNTTAQLKAHRWLQNLLELQQSAGNTLEFIESVKSDLFPEEIYVFTPKGLIVELPAGATPVDFAYAVHTDIGNTCIGARIDRQASALSQPLRSGQMVEIITHHEARPNAAWLNFTVSSKARAKIKQMLKTLKRSDSIYLGRRLLDHALGKNLTLEAFPAERLAALLHHFNYASLDDLLVDIGLGHKLGITIASFLLEGAVTAKPEHAPQKLSIAGINNGIVIQFATCCYPIPDDPIVAQVSTGKGLTIHHESCRHIRGYRQSPDEFIAVEWAKELDQSFLTEVKVEMLNHQGAIAKLAAMINMAQSNIHSMNTEEKDGRSYKVYIALTVRNRIHLTNIMRKIRDLPDVITVTRNQN